MDVLISFYVSHTNTPYQFKDDCRKSNQVEQNRIRSHFNPIISYLIHLKNKPSWKGDEWYIFCQTRKTQSKICLSWTTRNPRGSSWTSSSMWFPRQGQRNSLIFLMVTLRDWFEVNREISSWPRCTENTQTDFTGWSRELTTSGYLRSPNAVNLVLIIISSNVFKTDGSAI